MRTSRVVGLAVCLLLGASGCAGLHHRPAATAEGPVATTAPAWGLRGWWARKFHRGTPYQTSGTGPNFAPPASAWPASGSAGGGWPAIHQFSKPPWVTRQPERAPIFSRNTTETPSQPKMTAAEANEAIARMVKAGKNDDRILPVRGDSRQEPPRADDDDPQSALSRPIPLPDALASEPDSPAPPPAVADDPRPNIPDDVPSLLLDPAVPRARREVAAEAMPEPAAPEPAAPEHPPRVALSERDEEPLQLNANAAEDEELVRSSQLPPPPPIRPVPGAGVVDPEKAAAAPVPLDAPKEEPAKPADAPKPAEPAPTPKPVEEPVKPDVAPPAPAPKPVEEPAKPVEPPPAPVPAPTKLDEPVMTPVAPTSTPPAEPSAVPQAEPPPPARASITPALAVEDATAWNPVAPVAQSPVVQAPVYAPTVAVAPTPAKAHRWSFWKWKGSKGEAAYASPQSMPASLPPATFPASYDSYWARPLTPCPPSARFATASPQATTHSHECEESPAAEKAPCWLIERFKGRVRQVKAWKEEHICRHIKDFKAALKGDGRCHECQACQACARPTPQTAPAPSPQATPQGLPVIGGSRFGLY